jgi:hypothetical protein
VSESPTGALLEAARSLAGPSRRVTLSQLLRDEAVARHVRVPSRLVALMRDLEAHGYVRMTVGGSTTGPNQNAEWYVNQPVKTGETL